MLNISKKSASCFVNFSRLQQITNIQAEIYQVSYVDFLLSTSSTGKKILIGSNSNFLALRTVSSTWLDRCLLVLVNSSSNSNSSS